jgi:hypothetical protein
MIDTASHAWHRDLLHERHGRLGRGWAGGKRGEQHDGEDTFDTHVPQASAFCGRKPLNLSSEEAGRI